MDYIRTEDTALTIVLLIVGALIILAGLVSPDLEFFPRVAMVGFGALILVFSFYDTVDARVTKVRAEIAKSYGLELTEEQIRELDYPIGESEADFERYGTTVVTERDGSGYSERRITLLWDEGDLLLAEVDSAGDLELLSLRR